MRSENCLDEKIQKAIAKAIAEVVAEVTPVQGQQNGTYCIVRSVQAGVFAGYVEKMDGDTFTMTNVRKLHHWKGAAAVQGLALHGTSKPDDCRFTEPVQRQTVYGVCECIPATEKARKNIEGVKLWKA